MPTSPFFWVVLTSLPYFSLKYARESFELQYPLFLSSGKKLLISQTKLGLCLFEKIVSEKILEKKKFCARKKNCPEKYFGSERNLVEKF